jgi:hypothetical protein
MTAAGYQLYTAVLYVSDTCNSHGTKPQAPTPSHTFATRTTRVHAFPKLAALPDRRLLLLRCIAIPIEDTQRLDAYSE